MSEEKPHSPTGDEAVDLFTLVVGREPSTADTEMQGKIAHFLRGVRKTAYFRGRRHAIEEAVHEVGHAHKLFPIAQRHG